MLNCIILLGIFGGVAMLLLGGTGVAMNELLDKDETYVVKAK